VASEKQNLLVGRERELDQLRKTIQLGRSLLIEGPVGVGKTHLVREALVRVGLKAIRVDGDSRYTEQKLTGWFDPPLVLKQGYRAESFIPGPLVEAMTGGKILFINELNRMPEGVQNILLPALDEHLLQIPHLGEVKAKKGFAVIGTQNPREFTATHALAEALLDRFELIRLGYQGEQEERAILAGQVGSKLADPKLDSVVRLIRATRSHPAIKRGASIRAGLAICDLLRSDLDFETACLMALSARIEMVSPDDDPATILKDLLAQVVPHAQKKNETRP
jgi:MoxR-like ATPase